MTMNLAYGSIVNSAMRRLFILFILTANFKCYSQNEYIDPLNLTWADYKGRVEPFSPYMAVTAARISLGCDTINGVEYYPVSVDFLRDRSWVDFQKSLIGGLLNSFYLLDHERLHYYISIYFARMLKVYVLKTNPKTFQERYNLMTSFNKQTQDMDDLYDLETDHSKNKINQQKWNEKVMAEINSTNGMILDLSK